MSLLFLVGVGVFRLTVSSDVILWFPPDSELRLSYDNIRERFSGITPVNVFVEADQTQSVTTPRVLAAIDALAEDLRNHPSVGKVLSVADPLRMLQREFADDGLDVLPDSQPVIDQYLLILDGVEEMEDVLATDRRSANILLRVDNNSSAEIVDLAKWVTDWWSRNGIPGYRATATGIMHEFGRAQHEIAIGGLWGVSIALAAIGVVLVVFFRTPSLAGIALLANAAPICILFGLLGWVGIPLDAGTVCVASLALGIAVDDTIHVVSAYSEESGKDARLRWSLEQSFMRVLPALLFTTITISLGFGVLGVSDFVLVRNLGILMTAAACLCLISDTLLLPALLVLNGTKRRQAIRSLKYSRGIDDSLLQ
jgi:predicted RND superfamily exporter protein